MFLFYFLLTSPGASLVFATRRCKGIVCFALFLSEVRVSVEWNYSIVSFATFMIEKDRCLIIIYKYFIIQLIQSLTLKK